LTIQLFIPLFYASKEAACWTGCEAPSSVPVSPRKEPQLGKLRHSLRLASNVPSNGNTGSVLEQDVFTRLRSAVRDLLIVFALDLSWATLTFLSTLQAYQKMRQAVNTWLFGVILTCLILSLLAVALRIIGRRNRNSLQMDD
ncbi:hypothetical protein E4T48_07972, partial [Aureobasidium sp. EXF-10727]